MMHSHQEPKRMKCCKIKYKVRCFYSKGAFLVLVWTSLISAATSTAVQFTAMFDSHLLKFWMLAFVVPLPFSIPVIGWLADTKLGNYRVFKLGSSLCCLATVLYCIQDVYIRELQIFALTATFEVILGLACFLGVAACLLTNLQLGIDQMPDASSANITSFIAWFTASLFLGVWISGFFRLSRLCVGSSDYDKLYSLFPAFCMAVVCCSLYLLGPKWLVIEPKSPQCFETIYRVLKFAAKHKAPLNRSAFTYWEDDIPSRLDLGKERYGGPFTTEQVEDVKTLLKILLMFVPIFIISFGCVPVLGYYDIGPVQYLSNNTITRCHAVAIYQFTLNPWWTCIVTTVVYELAFYPVIRNRLPTTLQRIGLIAFLLVLLNIAYLVVHSTNSTANTMYLRCVPLPGPLLMFLINAVLEFICSQAPYNMRGQLTGYFIFLIGSSIALFVIIFMFESKLEVTSSLDTFRLGVIVFSIVLGLAVIGFLLHCVLARWYKRRVRDEDYSPHRVVEEVYDRYLTQEQSRHINGQ